MLFRSAGCGSKNDSSNATASETAKEAGFQEYPIEPEDKEAEGQIKVSLVYFQPVDIEPAGAAGLKASDASFHLKADVAGLEGNTLGYGVGDFVPGLTIDYKIALKDGSGTPVTGTFMQMNASDRPHYGANIKLDQAGEYTVTLTIHSPQDNGWVLHVDQIGRAHV